MVMFGRTFLSLAKELCSLCVLFADELIASKGCNGDEWIINKHKQNKK